MIPGGYAFKAEITQPLWEHTCKCFRRDGLTHQLALPSLSRHIPEAQGLGTGGAGLQLCVSWGDGG